MSSVYELQKVIDDSHRIVFFGGAACSRGYVVRKEGLPQELLDELHDQKQTQEMAL